MEVRIIFLSLICLCLLTSPTLATLLLAKALAVKKAAIIGAGVAKKAALAIGAKKALIGLILKALLFKGILLVKVIVVVVGALIALKGGLILKALIATLGVGKAIGCLILKGLAFKGALLAKALLLGKGALLSAVAAKVGLLLKAKSALLGAIFPAILPTILNVVSTILGTVLKSKQVAGNVISKVIAEPQRPPVLYEDVSRPRLYYEAVPIIGGTAY